jgi:hypothetical protein
MKILLLAAALAIPATALAETSAPRGEAGFHERLYERYCEKLREGPEAYVQFVRRLYPVHGLSYSDFAPAQPGAPVRADCRASPQRVAAVQAMVAKETR